MSSKRCLLLLSGGIDSTTVLAWLIQQGQHVFTVTFDYGQSLSREVGIAAANSERWGAVSHIPVNLPLDELGRRCTLLGAQEKLERDRSLKAIAASGTPSSYVPFRNGIFLAYLVGLGEAWGIQDIYAGCNGLNSGNYYDDTLDFGRAFQAAAVAGTAPDYEPVIHFPYAEVDKAEIVNQGLDLGVDYTRTYSCYANEWPHCGRCDSCVQRKAAMASHGRDLQGELLGAGEPR